MPFAPRIAERAHEARTQELICYLWDNYIQIATDAPIFLLGVGNAHVGVKALLTGRGEFTTPQDPSTTYPTTAPSLSLAWNPLTSY